MKHQIKLATESNGWFTLDNICFACENWSEALTQENLKKWLRAYNLSNTNQKTIAVGMAGNIPVVALKVDHAKKKR